ncbi:MAG TPA: rhomboid family intramembrane serine protease, partial [Thermoanaerobaculia bacterium]|nr:rhomboid family intramembrane serine protease [Thermoanaerobaculia bacterium]
MIPIRHTHLRRHAPVVTRSLVAANFLIFFLQLYLTTPTVERLIQTFGYIPSRLFNAEAWGYAPWEVAITLVSSLFLHGGFVHLFGNMIYLWVFGDAVEDILGHSKYLVFFIACGVVGSLAHTFVFPHSVIPSIGASGSIAGILGA